MEARELHEPTQSQAIADAGETARRVVANVARVIHAPEGLLERCMMALLCEGHIILEDFPGVGKTMLAKSIARSLDCEFARIQATPDLLPSDITGVNVFNLQSNEFEFRPGPVFANLVLVDEINRASPKTQSALLECMQEVQVTIDGATHRLARPFMVIATQNPIEYEGTFPLPEAQLDRFAMRLHLGYPSIAEEARMLSEHAATEPIEALEPVASAADLESRDRGRQGRLRGGEPEPLRGRDPAPHPRRRPAGAGHQPARRHRADAGGQGARRPARARVRDPGRRQGRGRRRARPPRDHGGRRPQRRHRPGRGDRRGGRADAGAGVGIGAEVTARGKGTLALAFGLYVAAWGFGTSAMYPVAVGLMAAPVLAWLWVRLTARPTELRRRTGHRELVEGGRVLVDVELRAEGGVLPARAAMEERVGDLGVRPVALRQSGHTLRGRYAVDPAPRAAATRWRRPSW